MKAKRTPRPRPLRAASQKKRLERLRNLARVMADAELRPKISFDLDAWGGKWAEDDPNRPACGTTACAAGWCGVDPWFNNQGLWLRPGRARKSSLSGRGFVIGSEMEVRGNERGRHDVFGALALFFGITEEESNSLFYPGTYANRPRPIDVLARVGDLYRKYNVPPKALPVTPA